MATSPNGASRAFRVHFYGSGMTRPMWTASGYRRNSGVTQDRETMVTARSAPNRSLARTCHRLTCRDDFGKADFEPASSDEIKKVPGEAMKSA